MKFKKMLKNWILLTVVVTIFIYLLFAFVACNLKPIEWNQETRMFFVIASLISTAFTLIAASVINEEEW